jgi:hypothetical protein
MISYRCPGCGQPIAVGVPELVGVCCSTCRAAAAWRQLPAALQGQIDALLRRRNLIQSIKLLMEAEPRPSLADAVIIAAVRHSELYQRGEVAPEPPVTADSLLAAGRDIGDRVVAVEAYWDGDSFGWYVRVAAIVRRPGPEHPRFDEVFLGSLGDGDTEKITLAMDVAVSLGVPFHFTQPERADVRR